jgi:hypothetical protein
MTKNCLQFVTRPLEFEDLVFNFKPVIYTIEIQNSSNMFVDITNLSFIPEDPCTSITGGSVLEYKELEPGEVTSIELTTYPRKLGTINQVLKIDHDGVGPPLWLDISFNINIGDAPGGDSFLLPETWLMDRMRRLQEQDGHRQFANVNVRDHGDVEPKAQAGMSEGVDNGMLANPWLNSQRFDGIDPSLNPAPPLNTEARREFDNEKNRQEMEKQLRLGNMPQMSRAPRPQGL